MKINYFSENKQPTRMSNIENRLRTLYIRSLDRIHELGLILNPSDGVRKEIEELRTITDQLSPLVDELQFEMKLRDTGYIGKLADYES